MQGDGIRSSSDKAHRVVEEIDDDVIKLKHFLRYWPFVRGIHRSPLNSPHKASDAEV